MTDSFLRKGRVRVYCHDLTIGVPPVLDPVFKYITEKKTVSPEVPNERTERFMLAEVVDIEWRM